MKIDIIGAGMAGLLAANVLRRHNVHVYEAQDSLPNNHHATLRFRSPDVGNVLGLQFRKVNMIKTYVPYQNIAADSISYSKKVTGIYRSDRSIVEGTVIAERYIAPPDLIKQMAKSVEIKYGKAYDFKGKDRPIISTIPMPVLMKILKYKNEVFFNNLVGIVGKAVIEYCDAYISVLFPNPAISCSRATITGDQLIMEFPGLEEPNYLELKYIYKKLGIDIKNVPEIKFKKQDYFKIVEINETERQNFMKWASVHYNIYSLGRYATWRPKLLLDDLVKDIRTIESWIIGAEK